LIEQDPVPSRNGFVSAGSGQKIAGVTGNQLAVAIRIFF
jgi:hypothetical protein